MLFLDLLIKIYQSLESIDSIGSNYHLSYELIAPIVFGEMSTNWSLLNCSLIWQYYTYFFVIKQVKFVQKLMPFVDFEPSISGIRYQQWVLLLLSMHLKEFHSQGTLSNCNTPIRGIFIYS